MASTQCISRAILARASSVHPTSRSVSRGLKVRFTLILFHRGDLADLALVFRVIKRTLKLFAYWQRSSADVDDCVSPI